MRASTYLALVAVALVALFLGWRALWFLTDDAFIHFRYVGNSVRGDGYVWNPPPFRPVEGYTSFLWVALLDLVWRVSGHLPTVSANWLSLGFTAGSLVLTARVVARMRLSPALAPRRAALLALTLLGLVTHRTFLTWSSSGLETAMFDFFVLLWLVVAARLASSDLRRGGGLGALGWAASASLVYLSRPEGLLFVAATGAALVGAVALGGAPRRLLFGLLGLAPTALHLAWRRSFYGAWLPNTYYAKHVEPWPEAGWHYLSSYALEHALWVWALAVLWYGGRVAWRRARSSPTLRDWAGGPMVLDLAVLTELANLGYYTFSVGGDSFEYRVYAQAAPLVLLALVGCLARAGAGPRTALAWLAAFVLAGLPLPWIHWRLAREVPVEVAVEEDLPVPVAGALPGWLRWYGERFDREQAWLIERLLCGRHHSHLNFCQRLREAYPERDLQQRLDPTSIEVLPVAAVGVAGWSLPHVAVIDVHGLNDYVVARIPVEPSARRQMAHDRLAPAKYVEAFRPTLSFYDYALHSIGGRREPLTAAEVRRIEEDWRGRAAGGELGGLDPWQPRPPRPLRKGRRKTAVPGGAVEDLEDWRLEGTPGRWHHAPVADAVPLEEQLEQLEALGYASGTELASELEGGGVLVHDPERAQPGWNLVVSGHACEVELMDMEGRVLHRWARGFEGLWPGHEAGPEAPGTQYWRRAHLLAAGDLLVIQSGTGIARLDRDSQVVWKLANGAHHDLDVGPDGTIYTLTRRARLNPKVHPSEPILEDFVARIGADGTPLGEWSMVDALEGTEYFEQAFRLREGDVLHTNSIELLVRGLPDKPGQVPDLVPGLEAGKVLVSMRENDMLATVDLEVGRVAWALSGAFRGQHDPQLLEDGSLLLFDNEGLGQRSRILQLDPATGERLWSYGRGEAARFHSATCGAVQRLPNGNTLLTESDSGRAFEIDGERRRVWEYLSPHRAGPKGEYIATLFEVRRLPADLDLGWIE